MYVVGVTHNADDRPKFYSFKTEAHWLFHNAVAHPVVGVLGFTAAVLHHTGGRTLPAALLDAGERLHNWSMPRES